MRNSRIILEYTEYDGIRRVFMFVCLGGKEWCEGGKEEKRIQGKEEERIDMGATKKKIYF